MKSNAKQVADELTQFIVQNYPHLNIATLHSAVEILYTSTAELWANTDKNHNHRLYAQQQAKVIYEQIYQAFS